ncbi:MAG: DUF262 domain-containing protein [Desulfobulbus sp.]|nr:DUF262 domain-containing protein [Desulfobulbus sp.]
MATTSKITPSSPRLATLLSDVERGNIKIPVFQRQFIWSDEQIISLLDSIYRGYPVGSLLLWSTKEVLKHERNVGGFILPETPEDYPVNYILDGQQRLTTLYGVFHSDDRTTDAELADRFNICYVPEDDEFMHYKAAAAKKKIFLRDILDTAKLLSQLPGFSQEESKKIALVTERFKDYEFPVVTIKERTNKEVCSVFQRINSSGTPLSNIELLAAWTWSDQFDLRQEIERLLDTLADKGYEQIDQPLLMRMIASITIDSIDSDDLVNVDPDKLIEGVKLLKSAIFLAVDFLEGQLKIRNVVFLPFPIMLIPITRFFSLFPKPDASQLEQIKKWFWHCTFTQRYKAGTNRLVMEDIKKIKTIKEDNNPFEFIDFIADEELFTKSWRINSTAAKAALCLMAQGRPRSFLTGNEVDLGTVLSSYNAREFHHIYPKGYLSTLGIGFHEANIIANICLLASSDNKSISDDSPDSYFQKIPESNKDQILESSFIPTDGGDGKMLFNDFIKARSTILVEKANTLVRNGSL